MKLREALAASNCETVTDDCHCKYCLREIENIRFVSSEQNYWKPVMKKSIKYRALCKNNRNGKLSLSDNLYLDIIDAKKTFLNNEIYTVLELLTKYPEECE